MKSKLFPNTNNFYKKFNARPVELFRIAFGVITFIQTLYFIKIDFVEENMVKPIIHFHYPGLSFIKPFPEVMLHALMAGMLISSILIVLGRYVKLGLATFFLSFTYLWLVDMGYFNNHYYLISLFAFLLFLIPGLGKNKYNLKANEITHSVPYWAIFILRFQWFIVFFIAGINKLNTYWLVDLQPMKFTFAFKADHSKNEFWNSDLLPFLFSYGGVAFDLAIGFLLWNKKTRKLAFFLLLGFNLFNGLFYADIGEIGIFPLFVMSAFLVFLDAKPVQFAKHEPQTEPRFYRLLYVFIWIWIFFQSLFPFRHLLVKDYVDWTGEGQRFSWRMKIAYKDADMKFFVLNENDPTKYPIAIEKTLTTKQYNNLGYCPDFLPQLGKFLASEAEKQGLTNPKVIADFKVGLNGGKQKNIISPNLPLNTVTYSYLSHNDWILTLD